MGWTVGGPLSVSAFHALQAGENLVYAHISVVHPLFFENGIRSATVHKEPGNRIGGNVRPGAFSLVQVVCTVWVFNHAANNGNFANCVLHGYDPSAISSTGTPSPAASLPAGLGSQVPLQMIVPMLCREILHFFAQSVLVSPCSARRISIFFC